jgi:hypothetical protein
MEGFEEEGSTADDFIKLASAALWFTLCHRAGQLTEMCGVQGLVDRENKFV